MDLDSRLNVYARTTTRTSPGCKARPFCCKAMVDRVSARLTCYSWVDLVVEDEISRRRSGGEDIDGLREDGE